MYAWEDQPSYPVFVPNGQTGILEPLRDDSGTNLTWRPDYKETQEYKDLSVEPEVKLESAKKRRARNLSNRAGVIRRGVMGRIFREDFIPFSEREEFLGSEEGKARAERAINNMKAIGKLDEVEAKEARNAFGI